MRNHKIIVSIIIATFNAGKTLRVALNSIFNQSFQDWECIVVDAVSKDNTVQIVQEYCIMDPRFKFISERDNGIYDAFNKGWKIAQGEWIYYLGADDKLTPNGIADLLKQSADYSIISGNVWLVHEKGKITIGYSKGYNGCHQGKLVKKTLLQEFCGFDTTYKILADKDLFIRIKNKGYKIKNIETIVAYFSLNGVSQNHSTLWNRMQENIIIYKNDKNTKFPLLKSLYVYCKSLIIIILKNK